MYVDNVPLSPSNAGLVVTAKNTMQGLIAQQVALCLNSGKDKETWSRIPPPSFVKLNDGGEERREMPSHLVLTY